MWVALISFEAEVERGEWGGDCEGCLSPELRELKSRGEDNNTVCPAPDADATATALAAASSFSWSSLSCLASALSASLARSIKARKSAISTLLALFCFGSLFSSPSASPLLIIMYAFAQTNANVCVFNILGP